MSKIMSHLLKMREVLTEPDRLARDEDKLHEQREIEQSSMRDYAEKWWEPQDNEFKDTDNPVF